MSQTDTPEDDELFDEQKTDDDDYFEMEREFRQE